MSSRTLSEIYASAKEARDKYLEHTEIANSSKMSVLDALTWTSSACIWMFENILDVFKVDLARDLQNRINGTPAYFASALLKYQSGDELVVSEDGCRFSYAAVDETKRVVTKVAYSEQDLPGFHDRMLVLKIATGKPGAYRRIDGDELLAIRAYLGQLLFAGQQARVVSHEGDILVPKLTVYHDGAVTEDEVHENIQKSLEDFLASVDFNGRVYTQKVIDAIQAAEHVVDVQIDTETTDHQGVFYASYGDDEHLVVNEGNPLVKAGRYFEPSSGYLKQSSCQGEEEGIPSWKQSIILKLEDER